MTRSVILVHGIQSNGYGSIFELRPYFDRAGLDTKLFQYQENSLLDTFSDEKSDENARMLLESMDEGDDLVLHSNGGRVGNRSMQFGAKYRQVYAFAPAFGAKTLWPGAKDSDGNLREPHYKGGFEKMNVIHNPKDWALWRGAFIPWHDFGHLGIKGYQGPHDERIHSISNLVENSVDRHNHSQMWRDPERLAHWAEYLIKRLSA